ncbi:hypothetical protein P7D22_17080 [Lichenihabitans sp. Uapishka_5]|uniref:hypothetical protein n=1 Tax=Lichenihabitans sp. Uapishka_5 TaxID=3037302 RepID=UPI0029E81C53|nr:hypothetical protein [Lichenihabitans sp. Uapishka_5]MDX7952882.1 hypothetical protein [Lichenihabitans sp. Uapishka_5]
MKTVLLGASLALALLSQAALAQQSPPPAPPSAPPQDQAHPAPPPGPQAGHEADDDGPDRGDMGRSDRWHHRRPPPPPTKAARFRVDAGDVALGMTCPEDEPLKNCQDFALQLLDKAGSIANRR